MFSQGKSPADLHFIVYSKVCLVLSKSSQFQLDSCGNWMSINYNWVIANRNCTYAIYYCLILASIITQGPNLVVILILIYVQFLYFTENIAKHVYFRVRLQQKVPISLLLDYFTLPNVWCESLAKAPGNSSLIMFREEYSQTILLMKNHQKWTSLTVDDDVNQA